MPIRSLSSMYCRSICTVLAFALPVILLTAPQASGQSVEDVGIAGEVILEDRYPDREFEFANAVMSFADVVYATRVGYRPLTLDLYLPPTYETGDASYPLLVVVHGGGWQGGHTRHSGAFSDWPAALASIANEGYVVASVEYRLSGEAAFPAAFDDVRDAIRWLRAKAPDYGIDNNRAAIMGGSAGGQLAALVGTACGENAYPAAESEATAESACVQAVVTWYGVFDFSETVPVSDDPGGRAVPGVLATYLGCKPTHCDERVVHDASAISWVDRSDPPFLMIHGVDDPVVAIEQSRKMHQALKTAGVASTLIEIEGVRHSFIGDTPEATIKASRKAWDETIDFISHIFVE